MPGHLWQPVDLSSISYPPTGEDLFNYVDTPLNMLPKTYKRADHERYVSVVPTP